MSIDAIHPEYAQFSPKWFRARDVLSGEDTVKAAGIRYLPRLSEHTDEEFAAYAARACFFNATARTAEGFSGMIFRRDPVIKLPSERSPHLGPIPTGERRTSEPPSSASLPVLEKTFARFQEDVDCLGTTLYAYAKRLTAEVLAVGRAGTLIEWNDDEQRAFLCQYRAEQMLNWRSSRIGGRNVLSMVVLSETATIQGEDEFEQIDVEQIRVLKLGQSGGPEPSRSQEERVSPGRDVQESVRGGRGLQYVVELWQKLESANSHEKQWRLVETKLPLRMGKPLASIPFIFHGPYDSLPNCAKPPLDDIIALNLDHYRLDADYKHGLHFTALPTAWVSGFDKEAKLKIGSSAAWVTEVVGAQAGFLEFKGQGLETFERAMDRVERLMAILGSRLLEAQKRVSESAEALSLRQAGEGSIVANLASSLSKSLTEGLRWVYWWHSTATDLNDISPEVLSIELNRDYETATMTPPELVALVQAWQAGAISRDSMLNLMRRGELLEPSRSNIEEELAVRADMKTKPEAGQPSQMGQGRGGFSGGAAAGSEKTSGLGGG
jgi:hypothetical protein